MYDIKQTLWKKQLYILGITYVEIKCITEKSLQL